MIFTYFVKWSEMVLSKMEIMILPVFSTLISLLVNNVAANENSVPVPVFVLDYDQVMTSVQIEPNPFAKLTSDHFGKIVQDSAKYKVIIFIEETFSVEDISTKDKTGTVYKHLRGNLLADKSRVKYLPSVIQPYQTLKKIFPENENNVFYVAQRTKLQLKFNFKHLYMYFQDAVNETKSDVLRRHDHIMKEILNAVRQLNSGPIVAYYTGKWNPVSVKKVESPGVSSELREGGDSGSSDKKSVHFCLKG